MLTVRMKSGKFSRKINNSVLYSKGFLQGIKNEKPMFLNDLAELTKESLYKYIDAKARLNPEALHHVYEPSSVGSSGARLFRFDVKVDQSLIIFNGSFLPSKRTSENSNEPFREKARIMENGISIVVEPKNSEVLAFENDGELVFTRSAVTIEHPGGDQVAGSFGRTVDSFFEVYFTNAILQPMMLKLQNMKDYSSGFYSALSGGASAKGRRAGKNYLNIVGDIE